MFALAARRKLVERARQAGLGGFKNTSVTELKEPPVGEMWDGKEGKWIYYFLLAFFYFSTFTLIQFKC